MVVPATEQAARDNDRVEILRQELKKSEVLLETLARRKADRLAASDQTGATEAEEQYTRTLSDVAGLQRELAGATQVPASSPTAAQAPASTAVKPIATRSPAARATAPTPWWDVYGKGRRAEAGTPISLAPPSAQATPRPVSAR